MKLFIANIYFGVEESELQEVFSQHGEVKSVKIIKDRQSGRSKGFGFVEMSTEEEMENAIEALNGYELKGRSLVVNKARPEGKSVD